MEKSYLVVLCTKLQLAIIQLLSTPIAIEVSN